VSSTLVSITDSAEDAILSLGRSLFRSPDATIVEVLEQVRDRKDPTPLAAASACMAPLLRFDSAIPMMCCPHLHTSCIGPVEYCKTPEITGNPMSIKQVTSMTSFIEDVRDHIDDSFDLMNRMIVSGVDRECAESVLPFCTQTRLQINATVRGWTMAYYENPEPLGECYTILSRHMPNVANILWRKND